MMTKTPLLDFFKTSHLISDTTWFKGDTTTRTPMIMDHGDNMSWPGHIIAVVLGHEGLWKSIKHSPHGSYHNCSNKLHSPSCIMEISRFSSAINHEEEPCTPSQDKTKKLQGHLCPGAKVFRVFSPFCKLLLL